MAATPDRILTFREVQKITGRSRSTIWRWEKAGLFPRRARVGPNSVGWIASEVQTWMEKLPRDPA